ncbi:hypothetical protein FEM48_Zijuj10G0166900 [Ziziphus jujuba var. spinosa]|uniref:Uncharacterized protein n=1 Tax=Ziziphus jujuba var. spinosa TaxID=714518 RepID=A0A978UPI7_ZIZJJ|nr:hypothetical protein FEM48_Zijuj10G0166900 [Ziziphus jujuba var. spinosa]
MSLPDSVSQLSNLRHFTLDNCSKLGSLPKLPLNVKHVQAHDCPILKDKMTIWPSDKGFSFINCRKSVKAEGCLTHHPLPMPEEHIPTLFPKFIQDKIFYGGNLELRFPCARIPDWCIHLSSGSSKRIGLPEKDSGCLKNPLEIETFNGFKVGSYGLCAYVPKTRFGNQLDRASHIEASISTDRSDVEVLECGLHVIFNKVVARSTQDLVDTSNEHLNLTSIKHYKHILEKASELERSDDVHELQPYSSPKKQVFGTLHLTSQLKRDLRSLLSTMIQTAENRSRSLAFKNTLLRTSIPNVEVERFGIRAIYEKDLGNVIEMITECQLGCADDEQLCYQAYEMLV